ncbi:SHOCT domain-containing protein [Mycobacterium sp. CVI_P3]|uniref:SHOCT domain-containing protein n=1 Tax=Mycobacterium pinniadriaticum TaxID=2994102 RepID=A0ABT3SLN3_9MYCO|nr:SHOCT domain-containing protein [Mycobacterium pinniadriaticum]MCX2933978.1 SHOCT domain-containing protein [Mycobacterium pinniadriaticum]MCX2940426.1 SHOCT domain-containing protein [Mycobacterium pinniadriaticum]
MCWGNNGWGHGWMWNGYGNGVGWFGWVITAIVLTLVFAAVITAIVVAIRYLTGGGQHNSGHQPRTRTAEDLLADRFARGEIDEDDYRRRMTALSEHR